MLELLHWKHLQHKFYLKRYNSIKSTLEEKPSIIASLTKTEHKILKLIAENQTSQEIADTLFVSAETVKTHVSSIIGKMGVKDRTQAVIKAIKAGI